MKFSCSKEKLLKAIQVVQRAVSAKSTLINLTGIYIEAQSDKLIFLATDNEILIQYEVSLTVEQTGKALLPAKYLVDLVRRLPNTEITIEQKTPEQVFIFHYGSSQIQLIGMDPTDYPEFPAIHDEQRLYIVADSFQNMIAKVSTASTTDTMRPIFTGIYLETNKEKQLNMVATDTHRLAFSSINLPEQVREIEPTSLVIPTKALTEITRLIEDEDEFITIKIGKNQVLFELGEIHILTRIIEGKFPDYKQVIPNNYSTRIKANTQLLLEAVDRATILAQNNSKIYSNVLKITTKGDTLIIEARSQEIGQAYEELPIYLEGEEIEINFNGRYLLDALRVIEAKEVYFDFTGVLSPGIFRPADSSNFLYLVLPVRNNI